MSSYITNELHIVTVCAKYEANETIIMPSIDSETNEDTIKEYRDTIKQNIITYGSAYCAATFIEPSTFVNASKPNDQVLTYPYMPPYPWHNQSHPNYPRDNG